MQELFQLAAFGVLGWTVKEVVALSKIVASQAVQIGNLQRQLDADSDLVRVLQAIEKKIAS